MQLSDFLFVPSVQHTGTWFVINFLNRIISNTRGLTTFLEDTDLVKSTAAKAVYRLTYSQPITSAVLHVHLPIVRYFSSESDYYGTWFEPTSKYNLSVKCLSVQAILLFCNFFKTVIPLRDPMSAILTRESRSPQLRHFYIVDGFVSLATEFVQHPNVTFLPIDLPLSFEQRKELLMKIVVHCGRDPVQFEGAIKDTADVWKPENPTPNNRHADLYRAGKVSELQILMGSKWGEIDYLRNKASVILPFMESQGYKRRDLIKI